MYSKFIKLIVIRSILVCCGFAGRVLNGRFPQLCGTRERSTSQHLIPGLLCLYFAVDFDPDLYSKKNSQF